MPENKYVELKNLMETIPHDGFGDLKSKIDEKFSYSELRMVSNALLYHQKTQPETDLLKSD